MAHWVQVGRLIGLLGSTRCRAVTEGATGLFNTYRSRQRHQLRLCVGRGASPASSRLEAFVTMPSDLNGRIERPIWRRSRSGGRPKICHVVGSKMVRDRLSWTTAKPVHIVFGASTGRLLRASAVALSPGSDLDQRDHLRIRACVAKPSQSGDPANRPHSPSQDSPDRSAPRRIPSKVTLRSPNTSRDEEQDSPLTRLR